MSPALRYPPQFLDRLRQHFRLSEVIGRRLTLRKAGREFHALCPFHNEKTPSFTINDEKAFYHCFGCGAHGDVINFIKDYEGLSWQQAVESLAREAGLELPKLTLEMREKFSRSEVLFGTIEKSSSWFSQRLSEVSGAQAMDYLKKRGVTNESLAVFRLGFAPDSREALKNHLAANGVNLRDMEDCGLLSKNDSGQIFDKFRGRIIFPIRDISGRVVGFGGRLMAESERAPKYLNSPQTELFDKGRLLYNADQARVAASRGQTLLVAEGYMDVIALHQAGFAASVAPLGTAVTEDHLRLMWQLADEPVICLDGDNAGLRAMARVATLAMPLLKPGKSLRFCLLPKGEDPDSLIKARGAVAMKEAIDGALPLVEMLWRLEVLEHKAQTPEQRAAAEQRLMRTIDGIKDATVQRAYRDDMRQRLWEWGRGSGKTKIQKSGSRGDFDTTALKARAAGAQDGAWRRDACIRQMLSIVTYYPALLEEAEIEAVFTAMQPVQEEIHRLYTVLMDAYMDGHITREVFAGRAAQEEEGVWRTVWKPRDLRLLLKSSEDDGRETARMYFLRLGAQLLEIEISEDCPSAAEFDADDAARERLMLLQRQLQRLKSQDPLLIKEGAT